MSDIRPTILAERLEREAVNLAAINCHGTAQLLTAAAVTIRDLIKSLGQVCDPANLEFSGQFPAVNLRLPVGVEGDPEKHVLKFVHPDDVGRIFTELCGTYGGGASLIAVERGRQQRAEGFTAERDDGYTRGQLATAGAGYAITAGLQSEHNVAKLPGCFIPNIWPWQREAYKPSTDRIRNLVRAGALIAAEIDRLQRLAAERKEAV